MILAAESLFIDLVGQAADALLDDTSLDDDTAFRTECLTGWDQAYFWLCTQGRPHSRLNTRHVQTTQHRLGFPCWFLASDAETGEDQFRRMASWSHFVMCAIKVNPLVATLGGLYAAEAAMETVHRVVDESQSGDRPVCALTQGSNQIIAFLSDTELMASLECVNVIAAQPVPKRLIGHIARAHGAVNKDGVPVNTGDLDAFSRYRLWRYHDALYRLATYDGASSDKDKRPDHQAVPGEQPSQNEPDEQCAPTTEAPLSHQAVSDHESFLMRQPLISRTNSTVCWRADRPTVLNVSGTAPRPFMVTIGAGVQGPDERRAAELIEGVLRSSPQLGYDGVPLGTILSSQALAEMRGATADHGAVPNGATADHTPLVQLSYGPFDVHTGILCFSSFQHCREFIQRMLAWRQKSGVRLTTVSIPLRTLGAADTRTGTRLLPLAPFCAEQVLSVVDKAFDNVQTRQDSDSVPVAAIAGALNDLRIAARALLMNPEIASDADDLISALCDLDSNVKYELDEIHRPWAALQLVKFLTLAIYERQQTLWAEAAPPGSPFHSEGAGLQALAKAVEWVVGYIVNYAIARAGTEPPGSVAETSWYGRHRAGQIPVRQDEIKALTDDRDRTGRRWTGCLCLTVLQGVYISPGGIVHFTDVFAQNLAVTLPRIFHEAGHLIWELLVARPGGEDRLLNVCRGAPNKWMRGFGAAHAPIVRALEETFAHWVEYELFDRQTDFCVRSLWQNWLTSPHLAVHPVDAIQRIASIYLIADLTDSDNPWLEEALKKGWQEILLSKSDEHSLVEKAIQRAFGNARGSAPFGIESSSFPAPWLDEFASHLEDYHSAVYQTLRHLVLPFLRYALVEYWNIGLNLQSLIDLNADDHLQSLCECDPSAAFIAAFSDQQEALKDGRIVMDRLRKPIRQILDLHKHVTKEGSQVPALSDPLARIDVALLLSLCHVWELHSTYPSFISRPTQCCPLSEIV
ncbi:hypothetical protein LLH23_15065 [bacterium]|nr:hypothetical protein [bacterium]